MASRALSIYNTVTIVIYPLLLHYKAIRHIPQNVELF